MEQNNNSFFGSLPVVTKNIIIINLIVWLIQYVGISKFGFNLADYLGLHYIESDRFHIYQLFTCIFLHDPSSILHVFSNMFAVLMIGRFLEMAIGSKKYLIYYLITGIGASLVQLLVVYLRAKYVETGMTAEQIEMVITKGWEVLRTPGMAFNIDAMNTLNGLINSYTVGASGAVFGILLAFGMLFPNATLMIIPIPVPIKAKYFVIGYGLFELYAGIADRTGDNVAHFAHLGGMIFGIFIILYWKKKYKKTNDEVFR